MSYKIGDTVKIVGGKRKGESGVIVAEGREAGRWKIRLKTGKKVRRFFSKKRAILLFAHTQYLLNTYTHYTDRLSRDQDRESGGKRGGSTEASVETTNGQRRAEEETASSSE